ncbi:hypothetical protein [Urechidicola vernalis]|uniref:DUF4199 domain-containing protein n=1 Tax=Urechidicola vernalis TaxID=3075600 RepID=A0ABU2Y741_9FLAO|nr:hypothetical protein [Urechidicola sp. P050]MDT0554014.1 hypothetical protein [Urechidicola sp. P050]
MSVEKIVITNAIKMYIGILLFFLLMKLVGLESVTELRMLNFLFVFWAVNAAIKKNIFENGNSIYFQNLFIGFFTALTALIFLVISLVFYLFYIDPSFLRILESSTLWGESLTPPLIAFAIFIEGIASSMICTFIVMQYWKNKKVDTTATV